MIERGFEWLARVLFVAVALALFALAISLVVSGSLAAGPGRASAARSASTI